MKLNNLDLTQLMGLGFGKMFRKGDGPRKVVCEHPDYEDVWVIVPPEYTLRHQARYAEAYEGVKAANGSEFMAELAGALALVDEFHFPGLKEDLSNLEEVPITLLAWLRVEVISDYMSAWNIPPKEQEESLDMSTIGSQLLSGSNEDSNGEPMEPSYVMEDN